MLEPLGFKFEKGGEPGLWHYEFLRPWKAGWNEGIGLYTSLRARGFAVEIGVVSGKGFFWSAMGETADWREVGLRTRLGRIARPEVSSPLRDFVPYSDQASLEAAVRRELQLALEYAPAEWGRMSRRLLKEE